MLGIKHYAILVHSPGKATVAYAGVDRAKATKVFRDPETGKDHSKDKGHVFVLMLRQNRLIKRRTIKGKVQQKHPTQSKEDVERFTAEYYQRMEKRRAQAKRDAELEALRVEYQRRGLPFPTEAAKKAQAEQESQESQKAPANTQTKDSKESQDSGGAESSKDTKERMRGRPRKAS